jgi:hypothetical protein
MRLVVSSLAAVLLALPVRAPAEPIFRWTDAAGGLHFSNRPEAVPPSATEVELPPLVAPPASSNAGASSDEGATEPVAPENGGCIGPDAGGLADAVAARLDAYGHLDDLTLLVAGLPVATPRDGITTVYLGNGGNGVSAPLEQAAIAYPAGSACPSRPPLARYAVASSRRSMPRRLCDDFQRAFAEVGVAVSRDQGVARSFRAIAEAFVDVAARGYATEPGRGVTLGNGLLRQAAYTGNAPGVAIPPWLVEAHIAQTGELSAEAGDLVDELTVALEEIDAAARASGCW